MAAVGVRDEHPAALTFELFRLPRRVEGTDRLRGAVERRIVGGDANVREYAGSLATVQRRTQLGGDQNADLRLGLCDGEPER